MLANNQQWTNVSSRHQNGQRSHLDSRHTMMDLEDAGNFQIAISDAKNG
jgi:hypothetical protein